MKEELARLRRSVEAANRIDERAEAAYLAGASLSQIADVLNVTLEAARQRLLARGVEMRPRGRAPKA